jgi:hypothetical protein
MAGIPPRWYTWSEAWYTTKVDGRWTIAVKLPKEWPERNYFAQVAGGYGSEVYVSTWNITKGGGQNNSYYKITLSGSTPNVVVLRKDPGGQNRPPSVVGPSAQAVGDGKVHAIRGAPQSYHYEVSNTGAFSGGTNISRTPASKTVEGMQAFFMGSDIGFITHWWDGNSTTGAIVNSLSRAKSGKTGIIAGTGSGEFGYPRGNYDPVTKKAYILYVYNGRPAVTIWDPVTGAVDKLGPCSQGVIPGGTRGPGAGGIAPRLGGGMHVIYCNLNKLYYRTVSTIPLGIDKNPVIHNPVKGLKIFPNPVHAAGSLRIKTPDWIDNFTNISIFDISGRLVYTINGDRNVLLSGIPLNTAGLNSGTYIVTVKASNRTLSGKLLFSQ